WVSAIRRTEGSSSENRAASVAGMDWFLWPRIHELSGGSSRLLGRLGERHNVTAGRNAAELACLARQRHMGAGSKRDRHRRLEGGNAGEGAELPDRLQRWRAELQHVDSEDHELPRNRRPVAASARRHQPEPSALERAGPGAALAAWQPRLEVDHGVTAH